MINEIIEVKQLPVITQKLRELSLEIDKKVEMATKLVCTEESVKEVKKYRADLNKLFEDLENRRKAVKTEILNPYSEFEQVYKECVTEKFANAKKSLDDKVNAVESVIKKEKEDEVRAYFDEYATSEKIDFVNFEQAKINITLSASMKSLREQAKNFIDKIVSDLALIDTQEHKAEIMVEYKQSLNASAAIMNVNNRFKAIEEEKKRQEELAKIQVKEQVVVEKVVEVLEAPTVAVKEEIYTMTFTVKGTKEKLKQLKNYLIQGGYINE